MKVLIVLALFLAIGLIFASYKRENNNQKLLFSVVILAFIVAFAILGNTMRSIIPLFLAHIKALMVAYGGLIYYIFREKTVWIAWLMPLFTLILYLLLAWIGNEHIIWFS